MKSINMTQGPILKQLLLFAIQIYLTNLLQNLYNAADSLIVGQFCGGNALAAVGTTTPICSCLIGLFLGISTGGSVVVSKFFGAGDGRGVHRAVHTGILLSMVCGLLISVLGVLFTPSILHLMNTDPVILEDAQMYLRIYFGGSFFLIIYNMGAGILRAVGDSRHPLFFLACSAATNVGLDLLFVGVFHWGVAGAAFATVGSQLVSAVLVIITLMRSQGSFKLLLKELRFTASDTAAIVKIGLPAGLQTAIINVSNIIIQTFINSFGAAATAGSTAASKLDDFILIISSSIGLALMTFAGQNIGAGNFKRVKKGTLIALALTVGLMLSLGMLASLFRHQLVGMFVDRADPNFDKIISFGASKVFYIATFYFITGISDILSATLRSCGSPIFPMITSFLWMCGFRIVWIYWLRFLIPVIDTASIDSIFIIYPITFVLTALSLGLYFCFGPWRKKLQARCQEIEAL